MKRIIIKVYGLVQGVFFRYTTRKVGRRLGITGIVKNMPDGSVYIEAEGADDKLDELLKFSRRGPKHSKVRKIEFEYKEAENRFKGFQYEF
ncbi:MAG: acylphosphatase [Promethearchaeota archaeon]